MINETIRRLRKEKAMSQEELAVRLNVVRQTISKWERGLSVPDAEMLIRLADVLGVCVSQLLDTEPADKPAANLAEELARVNALLAEKNARQRRRDLANRKRSVISFLFLIGFFVSLSVKNQLASVIILALCVLCALIILYRNLALLTSVTSDDMRLGVLRTTTVFNLCVFLLCSVFSVLVGLDVIEISEHGEKLFAASLICCIILLSGVVSPRLPFNRHTGLRLPWTVQDEETWKLAHRILGDMALPTAIAYLAATLTISNFDMVTMCTVLIWVGIPGLISYIFYSRKMRGML